MSTCIRTEWKTVTVEPERLRSGLWGYEEGDIAASYSADTYSDQKRLRRPFTHAFTPHVAMGIQSNGLESGEAKAYPLVNSSYADEIMHEYRDCGLRDGYVGKPIKRFGQDCVFGLPVIFKPRSLRKPEVIDLCRRMYAYGGLFAAEAGSYSNLMAEWSEKYTSPKLRRIFAEEIEAGLPQSQIAMRELIQTDAVASAEEEQLALL